MTLNLVIPMSPYPQPRPRHTRNGQTYVPKEAREARSTFQTHLIRLTAEMGPPVLFEGPVAVEIGLFQPPRPTNIGACPFCRRMYRELPAHMARKHPDQPSKPPTSRRKEGDGDNFEKFVLDACTGVLWKDDRQVVDCHWWFDESEEGRVELTVGEPQK